MIEKNVLGIQKKKEKGEKEWIKERKKKKFIKRERKEIEVKEKEE